MTGGQLRMWLHGFEAASTAVCFRARGAPLQLPGQRSSACRGRTVARNRAVRFVLPRPSVHRDGCWSVMRCGAVAHGRTAASGVLGRRLRRYGWRDLSRSLCAVTELRRGGIVAAGHWIVAAKLNERNGAQILPTGPGIETSDHDETFPLPDTLRTFVDEPVDSVAMAPAKRVRARTESARIGILQHLAAVGGRELPPHRRPCRR